MNVAGGHLSLAVGVKGLESPGASQLRKNIEQEGINVINLIIQSKQRGAEIGDLPVQPSNTITCRHNKSTHALPHIHRQHHTDYTLGPFIISVLTRHGLLIKLANGGKFADVSKLNRKKLHF